MRKSFLVASIIGVFLIVMNIYLSYTLSKEQVNYQKNILFKQAEVCGSNIEDVVQRFESDLNYILFSDDISDLFSDHYKNSGSLRNLELFYSSYSNLIKNIDIYDNNKNVLNLFKDKKNNYITDRYLAQRQRKLSDQGQVKVHNNEYQYLIPVFKDKTVFGNIVITIDFSKYLLSELNKYHFSDISFQWVIDPVSGNFITNYPGKNITLEKIDLILKNLRIDHGDMIKQKVISDSTTVRIITVYRPLNMLDHKFGLAFSFNDNFFKEKILSKLILLATMSLMLFVLTITYLLLQVRNREKKVMVTSNEAKRLNEILEYLPIGVIIFDNLNNILYINLIAREVLQVKEGEEKSGNSITQKFLMSGKSLKNKDLSTAYDTDQFILYQKEGNEVVLYKKEYPYFENDQEFILSAFIDITSLEKARKYEAAANIAKSEFLAKMSHEIRTPMNGIIGMTDALNHENLTKEQIEYVDIVKRSADLLLNIINDILDYSKIEAGKMQLEEIPFLLSEEVKLSLDLFRAIIDEKGLRLTTEISPNVPDEIIGDPFRLRQVLSNLISNAVKFTHEGDIRLTVNLEEQYNGNLSLLFEVADTGVGIPKERLESIFNSFTQAEYSTSRKYGGSGLGTTISKQLINLMNGEIWVESPSGISKNKKYPGSKFCFTIEVYMNKDLVKNIDYSNIKTFDQVNVFVITKNGIAKNRLINFLKHIGLQVDIVSINEEIIASIRKQLTKGKEYQLVIIVDEPSFDGLWIARQLCHAGITDNHRFIMISSNHKQENYIQTKVLKVDYYLTQPFKQEILKIYLHHCFPKIVESEQNKTFDLQKDLNILVAEDNLINQKVAESIFNNLGYKIDIALDGKEVVSMIKKKAYDIVFMDLQMPEKDGVDATVEIRGLGFQMPIVAMTATASKIGKSSAIISGMNDYITKPIKVNTVRTILEKWFT